MRLTALFLVFLIASGCCCRRDRTGTGVSWLGTNGEALPPDPKSVNEQIVFELREDNTYWSKLQTRAMIAGPAGEPPWEVWVDVTPWQPTGQPGTVGSSCQSALLTQWVYWCDSGSYWRKKQELYRCCASELARCWSEWRDITSPENTGVPCTTPEKPK